MNAITEIIIHGAEHDTDEREALARDLHGVQGYAFFTCDAGHLHLFVPDDQVSTVCRYAYDRSFVFDVWRANAYDVLAARAMMND